MFDDMVKDMDASLMASFGVEALWNERKVVQVVIDKDVVRVNEFGEAARNAWELSIKRDLANPTIGDTLRTADATFKVDQILNDDGHVIRCAVNKL